MASGLAVVVAAGVGAGICLRVLQTLIGVELADRSALGLVGLEQRRLGPALKHAGDLPRQVVRVLHARVHAEAAGRRKAVRGVTEQEDAPDPIALGHLRAHDPRIDRADVDRDARHRRRRGAPSRGSTRA